MFASNFKTFLTNNLKTVTAGAVILGLTVLVGLQAGVFTNTQVDNRLSLASKTHAQQTINNTQTTFTINVVPYCNDSKDNDNDGSIDTNDCNCTSSSDTSESTGGDCTTDPTAVNSPANTSVVVGESLNFDGSQSHDNDNAGSGPEIQSYTWGSPPSFHTDTGPETDITFPAPGTYNVQLTVTDNDGETDSSTKQISVSSPSFDLQPAQQTIWVAANAPAESTRAQIDVTNLQGISASDISFSTSGDIDSEHINTSYNSNTGTLELWVQKQPDGLDRGRYDIDVTGTAQVTSQTTVTDTVDVILRAQSITEF